MLLGLITLFTGAFFLGGRISLVGIKQEGGLWRGVGSAVVSSISSHASNFERIVISDFSEYNNQYPSHPKSWNFKVWRDRPSKSSMNGSSSARPYDSWITRWIADLQIKRKRASDILLLGFTNNNLSPMADVKRWSLTRVRDDYLNTRAPGACSDWGIWRCRPIAEQYSLYKHISTELSARRFELKESKEDQNSSDNKKQNSSNRCDKPVVPVNYVDGTSKDRRLLWSFWGSLGCFFAGVGLLCECLRRYALPK
jgi:hypothetical protein